MPRDGVECRSNIQGATDLAGIFDILPGYLKVPNPATDKDFKSYIERSTPKSSKPAPWDSFNYSSGPFSICPRLTPQLWVGADLGQHAKLNACSRWLRKPRQAAFGIIE